MASLYSSAFITLAALANAAKTEMDPQLINFQTGIDLGSTFAGGMTFDKVHNRVYLTGATYARGFFTPEAARIDTTGEKMNSDCFFVAVELANATAQKPAQWKNPTRLGYVKDPEACSTVHHLEDGYDRVFLGASASGASMGRVDIDGDQLPQLADVSLLGEVISISLDHIYHIAPVIPQHYLFGGHGFYQSEVNYPFAITSAHKPRNGTQEEYEEEAIYVASLYSKYGGQWDADPEAKEIDLSSPYYEGNVWGIAIQKIVINHSNATSTASILEAPTHMERAWMNNLETTNFQKLQATDMVFVNGYLLLAGSTFDFGEHFAGEQRTYKTYQDYDGFLVKLNPATGNVAKSADGSNSNSTEVMKLRIQSLGEVDDIIHGICLHPEDDDGYVPYVYVVGATHSHDGDYDETVAYPGENLHLQASGDHAGGGFVMQVDLMTMEVIWKDSVQGTGVDARDCAVTDDGQWLYVTGEAREDRALLGWESHGGSDVWVRQYGAIAGEVRWEIQLGSPQDESLAMGGAIVIDGENNAIIYGNTLGSVGRVRDESLEQPDATNDIFVTTISFDGGYLPPTTQLIFQIPRYYFGEGGTSHRVWIVCMFLVAVVVFALLMSRECEWTPVSMQDFKDLLPKSHQKEELPERDVNKIRYTDDKPAVLDLTETETEEEDDHGLYSAYEYGVGPSYASGGSSLHETQSASRAKLVAAQKRQHRDRYEEEKTEIC